MLAELIKKYRMQGVLLDTNLLLLLLIGIYSTKYISEYKRTAKYDENDFNWLMDFVQRFNRILITPQVLAEVSNFIDSIRQDRLATFLDSAIPVLESMTENHINKNTILGHASFRFIGASDTSIVCTAKENSCLVITDDLRAYAEYLKHAVEAININHLRVI